MRGCVFGAGAYHGEGLSLTQGAFVIAADAGYRHTEAYGVVPDLVVGDFDSMDPPAVTNLRRHPVMKDDTDMALAAQEALKQGCDELFFFGGMGGRPDHTLANLSLLLSLADQNCAAYLVGREGVFTAMKGPSGLAFTSSCRGTVSVFAAGDEAVGVSLLHLLYPLHDHTLYKECALGVSNSFIGKAAEISLKKGALLVFWEEGDNPLPARFSL